MTVIQDPAAASYRDKNRTGAYASGVNPARRDARRGPAGGDLIRTGDPTVELEPEVLRWLEGLPTQQFAQAAVSIDRLSLSGSVRQRAGKVGEMRFYVGRQPYHLTFWTAPGERIVLLTAFRRSRAPDRREIERAVRVLTRCVAERYVAEAVA